MPQAKWFYLFVTGNVRAFHLTLWPRLLQGSGCSWKPRQMRLPEKTRKESEEQLTLAKLGGCSPVSPRVQTALPGPLHCRWSWGHSPRVLNAGRYVHRDVRRGKRNRPYHNQVPKTGTWGFHHEQYESPCPGPEEQFLALWWAGWTAQLEPQEMRTAARGAALGLRDCTSSGSNHED